MKLLLKHILAVLPDRSAKRLDICIDGETISSVGRIPPGFEPDRTISGESLLCVPGFINAHTHAYMSPLRNWADDLSFQDWLFGKVMPVEERLRSDDAYWGALLSCLEMIRSGTTCFLDMHMFPQSSVLAAQETGMRAVISRGLSGGTEDPVGGERRLREAIREYEDCRSIPHLGFMLAPHAPYSCDEGYLRDIAAVARDYDLGIHTHLSESRSEVENCRNTYGVSPIGYFDRCSLLDSRTVAAHCVHLSEEDIVLLAERGVHVAVNTASNLKLGNGVSPVKRLLEAGVPLCLGTDGASSNNALSMLREMQLTALLHKGVNLDPQAVSAGQVFDMATRGGAAALGLSGVTGAIREGFSADLALFDLREPALNPLGDPVAALCYSAAGISAHTVIICGRIVLDNGEFTTVDAERIRSEVAKTCRIVGITED